MRERRIYKTKRAFFAFQVYVLIPFLFGILFVVLAYQNKESPVLPLILFLGAMAGYGAYTLHRDRKFIFRLHTPEPPFKLGDMKWEIRLEEYPPERAVKELFKDAEAYERVFRLLDSNFVFDKKINNREEGKELLKGNPDLVLLYEEGIKEAVIRSGREMGQMMFRSGFIGKDELPRYSYLFALALLIFISKYYGGLPAGLVNASLSFAPMRYFLSIVDFGNRFYVIGKKRRRGDNDRDLANKMLFVWNLYMEKRGMRKKLEKELFLPSVERE